MGGLKLSLAREVAERQAALEERLAALEAQQREAAGAGMSQEELQKLCAIWQRRLRLQDWQVKLVVERFWDHQKDDELSFARCHWFLHKKQARISMLDPGDFDPSDFEHEPVEKSLVHELVHLHLAELTEPLEKDTPQWRAMEQAVHALASALYDLACEAGEAKPS